MRKRCVGRIVVVCLHPTVDRTYETERLHRHGVIRGKQVLVEPAGKGVNVARTLATLGRPALVIGFCGRDELPLYEQSLARSRVATRFVPVAAATRQNLTLMEKATGGEVHLLDTPMRIRPRELARFRSLLRTCVAPDDWVVFSGSVPAGVRQADFAALLRLGAELGQRVVVDTSGGMLRAAMRTRPWLIKPNLQELAQLSGASLATGADALASAQSLLGRCGAVLLSLGAAGAILVTPAGAWQAREKRKAKVVHTVGCGDALLAGFLAATASGKLPGEALRRAVGCGSACVRSVRAGVGSRREVARLLAGVALRQI